MSAEQSKLVVQQKLGLDCFKQLMEQIKSEGVFVVVTDGADAPNRIVREGEVLTAKITSVFNLGKKLDVRTNASVGGHGHTFRFHKFNNVYYLVRK